MTWTLLYQLYEKRGYASLLCSETLNGATQMEWAVLSPLEADGLHLLVVTPIQRICYSCRG